MKELVITNIGTIVTGKLTDPITEHDTIAIRGGVIAEIGGPGLLEKYSGAEVIDAKGVTVAPGLIDSHCHPCVGDYTFRQKTDALIESEVHGGVTTIISAGEPHFPGRPKDAAGVKAQAIFLSKCFRNLSPLGAKVHGGAVILEQGLTESDFEEMAKEGVWLVGEVGLGSVKSPEDAAPLVAMAKRHGFKVHMHTGGTSIPGSSSVSAEDVIRTDPDIASHCNGGPTAVSMAEVERIIRESRIAVEIVQWGTMRSSGLSRSWAWSTGSSLEMTPRRALASSPLASYGISVMCPVYAAWPPIRRSPWLQAIRRPSSGWIRAWSM